VLSKDRIAIHQSQPLVWPSDLFYLMLAGCDWWISIRFRRCFVFQSRISTKTLVISLSRNGQAQRRSEILRHTSNRLLRNNAEMWSPRSSDKRFSRGRFSTPYFPGSWNKFSVDMCWNLSPLCTLNEHSHSGQQSSERDEFFCSRTAASFLDVSFVDNIEETDLRWQNSPDNSIW